MARRCKGRQAWSDEPFFRNALSSKSSPPAIGQAVVEHAEQPVKGALGVFLDLWAERKPERRNVDARIKKFWRVLKQNGVAVCGELSHMAAYAVCMQMHVKIHGVFSLPACGVLGIAA